MRSTAKIAKEKRVSPDTHGTNTTHSRPATAAITPWLVGITLMRSITVAALEELPVAYTLVAKIYQVPADILYAVALAESGKRYKTFSRPWPWALNIEGKSLYCQSKQEATQHLQKAIQQQHAVDIGLMQISWYWHQHRFDVPADALIPMQNLKVGAAILREQYERTGDWWEAVGRYHDPGQDPVSLDNARRYRKRVAEHWRAQFQ